MIQQQKNKKIESSCRSSISENQTQATRTRPNEYPSTQEGPSNIDGLNKFISEGELRMEKPKVNQNEDTRSVMFLDR